MKQLKLVTAAFLLLSPFAANADLIVTIQDAGNGQTEFTFSGEATYATCNQCDNRNSIGWTGGAFASLFATSSPLSISIASGSVSQSSSAGGSSMSLSDLYLTTGYPGFAARGGSFLIAAGAFVQWSGSVIANVAYSVFTPGEYATQTLQFGTLIRDDYYRVRVGPAKRVPEPGTLALLGLGLVGMGMVRRRKKV